MAGPNLEIFRFGLYLFVPVLALLHFGDPSWYHNHVLPYYRKLFPPEERLVKKLPTERAGIREELERIKAARLVKKQEREMAEAAAAQSARSDPEVVGANSGAKETEASAPVKRKWFGIF